MREQKNFAERTKILSSDETRKKYFLVYEGKYTELLYFQAVDELKAEIGLNPLIELVPVIRSYSEEGWSNPEKIMERLIQNLEESKKQNPSFETLLNWIMDYFEDTGYIINNRPLAKNMWKTLTWICEEILFVSLDMTIKNIPDTCKKIIDHLKQISGIEHFIEDIPKIINHKNLTYAEGFDKICFIVDRDQKSFTTKQYINMMDQCKKNGFGFYLTNPCFEFWLLMHFNDVITLDRKQLHENPTVTSKRRYTEQELRNRIHGYKKSKYDAISLVRNIDIAICNEQKFCEDIQKLENTIGSNIGLLICELREFPRLP